MGKEEWKRSQLADFGVRQDTVRQASAEINLWFLIDTDAWRNTFAEATGEFLTCRQISAQRGTLFPRIWKKGIASLDWNRLKCDISIVRGAVETPENILL